MSGEPSVERMELAFGVMEAAGLPLPYGMDRSRMIEVWASECGFASAKVLTYVARQWATTKCQFPCLAEFLAEVKRVDFESKPHYVGRRPNTGEGPAVVQVWEVLDLATGRVVRIAPSPEEISAPGALPL
jgi:hypothetical protein